MPALAAAPLRLVLLDEQSDLSDLAKSRQAIDRRGVGAGTEATCPVTFGIDLAQPLRESCGLGHAESHELIDGSPRTPSALPPGTRLRVGDGPHQRPLLAAAVLCAFAFARPTEFDRSRAILQRARRLADASDLESALAEKWLESLRQPPRKARICIEAATAVLLGLPHPLLRIAADRDLGQMTPPAARTARLPVTSTVSHHVQQRSGSAEVDPTRSSKLPHMAFADLASEPSLLAAWEHVRDTARERGRWNDELERFGRHVGTNLRRLHEQLSLGVWQPKTPRPHRLRKRSGGTRTLHIPPVEDRVVERSLAHTLSSVIDGRLSPWSFAFRPGLGVDDAVIALCQERDAGATHVARFDIRDCFDHVDRAALLETVEGIGIDPATQRLVELLVTRPLPGYADGTLSGIAQGSPLSPLLANLALDAVDQALLASGVPAVRYADDFAAPAPSLNEARSALEVGTRLLDDMGLPANRGSSVQAFTDEVRFLGRRITATTPSAQPHLDDAPPATRTLYATMATTHLSLRKGQVRLAQRDADPVSVPVGALHRIVILGPVGVSAGLRSHALRVGLDVVFLSRNGGWLGRYDSGEPVEPQLRRRQYTIETTEPERCRTIAGQLVIAKLLSQRALLQRYARGAHNQTCLETIEKLKKLSGLCEAIESTDQLLGYEGIGARAYFRGYGSLLPTSVAFTKRSRRPPEDNANAALSFAYVILTAEAHAAAASLGLDPYVGFLHAPNGRRPALALDLVEEFRPLVVDSAILNAFRRGRLQPNHFRRDGKAVLLNDAGRRAVLDAYETRMLTRVRHPRSERRVTYRHALWLQARQVVDLLRGQCEFVQPLGWR